MNLPIPYFLILFVVFSCNLNQQGYKNYDKKLPYLIDSLNLKNESLSVVIDKSEYKLSIASDHIVVKEYPVVFGGNPVDNKLMEGDQCTPEGEFNMLSKYPHAKWTKFIWLNYPTEESWKKHNQAKRSALIPSDAKIGGEIGIHGVPKGMDWLIDVKQNWTLGCVSLKNADMNEIYPFIKKDTPIQIRK